MVQFIPSGSPNLPTRQLLVTWVVKAWDMVPAELVRNSLTACGYLTNDMLVTTNKTTIVPYSSKQTITLLERICVPDSRTNFDSIECDADTHFHSMIMIVLTSFNLILIKLILQIHCNKFYTSSRIICTITTCFGCDFLSVARKWKCLWKCKWTQN